MLARKTVILAKIEANYGVDPIPAPATDGILVFAADIKPTGDTIERDPFRSTLSNLPFSRGTKLVDLTLQTELKGTGTRGALPAEGWEGVLFRACGMSETINAGVSIVHAPVSDSFESCTIYVYRDEIFHKIRGCRGSFALDMQVGKPGYVNWKFRGLYDSPVDASPGAQTFNDIKPPIFLASGLTMGGYAAIATKLALDINNTFAERTSMNAATGILGVEIMARKPQGSFDPETVTEATEDFWAKWEAATVFALAVGPVGSVPGNIVEIAAPGVQYREIAYQDRKGQLAYQIPFGMAMDAGDDEMQITYT